MIMISSISILNSIEYWDIFEEAISSPIKDIKMVTGASNYQLISI